jgi:hypothetical protein
MQSSSRLRPQRRKEEDAAAPAIARTAKIRCDQPANLPDKASAGSSSAYGTAKQIQLPLTVPLLHQERQQRPPRDHNGPPIIGVAIATAVVTGVITGRAVYLTSGNADIVSSHQFKTEGGLHILELTTQSHGSSL